MLFHVLVKLFLGIKETVTAFKPQSIHLLLGLHLEICFFVDFVVACESQLVCFAKDCGLAKVLRHMINEIVWRSKPDVT
jgi:hypothetical protein